MQLTLTITGGIFVVGNGNNEKYTNDGVLIAIASTGYEVQQRTGRIPVSN